MPLLKQIQKDYEKNLIPYFFKITLEDGRIIEFNFKKAHFKHLLGLHYIPKYNFYNANLVYQKISKDNITYEKLKKQKKYKNIEERILNFRRMYTLLSSNEVIEFDATLLEDCKLKSRFLLFDSTSSETLHLGLGKDGKYYPETWFTRKRQKDKYIKGQKRVKAIITKTTK